MNSFLSIAQIITAVLLGASILLQQKSAGLGGAFGGGSGEAFASRRGMQKKLHFATIILGIAFVSLAVANLFF